MFDKNDDLSFYESLKTISLSELEAEFRNSGSESILQQIKMVEEESNIPFMNQKACISAIGKEKVNSIFQFIAINPATCKTVSPAAIFAGNWAKETMTPGSINKSLFLPTLAIELLKKFEIDDTIVGGWVLTSQNGRIDQDITWREFTCVFATQQHYVYLSAYEEILH